MLATQLNHMINTELTEFTVCQINRYAISNVNNSGKSKWVQSISEDRYLLEIIYRGVFCFEQTRHGDPQPGCQGARIGGWKKDRKSHAAGSYDRS